MSDFAKIGVALTVGGAIGVAASSLLATQKAALSTTSSSKKTAVLPKLYIYDHCPFCVRARMILGFKKVPHELVFLANHDEATPIGLVGSKQAPILQPPSGKAFPESMDIVRYVDTNYGGSVLLKESADRDDIKQWIKDTAECFRLLYHPRFHAAVFPEFAQLESREYYRIKKEKTIGPFKDALAKSPELVDEANKFLEQLADLFHSNRSVNESLSYDDIDLFGRLRGLTLVKGLKWPKKLREYIDYMSEAADIPLLDSMARY
jgi:glutaredoxin 2